MKSKKLNLIFIITLFSVANIFAQIKNAKTESVKIYGNCEMCESTIEKAGYSKKTSLVDWDKTTKLASITYDIKKTNRDEILKKIALNGYDSDTYLAPDNAYFKLPDCCKYERVNKAIAKNKTLNQEKTIEANSKIAEVASEGDQLKAVFDQYFALKDELVKTNDATASTKAKLLLEQIKAVKMEKLTNEEHTVWMKVMKDLAKNAKLIEEAKGVEKQREIFIDLSKNIYELIKVSKQSSPIYYQFCPMANDGKGANWLSKEADVKNPYYGSEMLTCGKVVETIK